MTALERISGNRPTWRNWAGNQWSVPDHLLRPTTETEIVDAVRLGNATDRIVKIVGAGHSFTDIACTNGVLLSLDDYDDIVRVDGNDVTVQAGIRIGALCRKLEEHGLALPNLGDIDVQSVAGAISTGTHGTGLEYQSIAAAVVGLRLVTADGGVAVCSETERPDLLHVARVGLGALGLISEVTLRCEPAFNLHAVEKATSVAKLLPRLDELIRSNEHFEFFWLPYTEAVLTKSNNRTDQPSTGGEQRRRLEQELLENVGFGALNMVARRAPSLIPKLATALPGSGVTEYVTRSADVFTSPRRVRFLESEYAVPLDAFEEVFTRLRRLVDTLPAPVSFPVECRFLGADDIPLSMASGRASAFIAIHTAIGMPHEGYMASFEQIVDDVGGRPHWGKLHRKTEVELVDLYPEFDLFRDWRDELDPDRRWQNPYLARVLGD